MKADKHFGKLEAILGVSGMVFFTKAKKRDEVWSEKYLYRQGHTLDAQWGYVCEGFFNDEADIANHAKQTFGEVKPGDLKYKDLNNDGVIDDKDQTDLGKAGWGATPFIYVLIQDPIRAFADSELGGMYNRNFVTVEEFSKILDQLYGNGYILVDFKHFVASAEDLTGSMNYSYNPILLPEGKKPVMITETMVNYYDYMVDGNKDGNHYAATIAVYDMFDEVADSRKYTDDVFVEFRYYVPSAKYNAAPFGFLMVAFEGTPIFSASEINRTPLETWIDDKFYSYEIDSRQQIEATDADNPNNSAILRMTSAEPEPSDPYANLPAFQRNVASRFAKPVEYSIPIEYELDIDADGYKAKIPVKGSYSMTRLR